MRSKEYPNPERFIIQPKGDKLKEIHRKSLKKDGTFDHKKYWELRGESYFIYNAPTKESCDFYRKYLINEIERLDDVNSILNYGCGYGIITKFAYCCFISDHFCTIRAFFH